MMEQRGILATAVRDKERSAERELMEALERVGWGFDYRADASGCG